jgi:hypothetical protein
MFGETSFRACDTGRQQSENSVRAKEADAMASSPDIDRFVLRFFANKKFSNRCKCYFPATSGTIRLVLNFKIIDLFFYKISQMDSRRKSRYRSSGYVDFIGLQRILGAREHAPGRRKIEINTGKLFTTSELLSGPIIVYS